MNPTMAGAGKALSWGDIALSIRRARCARAASSGIAGAKRAKSVGVALPATARARSSSAHAKVHHEEVLA